MDIRTIILKLRQTHIISKLQYIQFQAGNKGTAITQFVSECRYISLAHVHIPTAR